MVLFKGLLEPRIKGTLIGASTEHAKSEVPFMGKLTDTKIKSSKPAPKEYTLSDGDKLGVVIKPNGSKLWKVRYYKPHTKIRSNISLGSYPALTLAQARKERDKINELLVNEIDPKEDKVRKNNEDIAIRVNTFEKVARDWLAIKKTEVKAGTYKTISSTLENHIFPQIGKFPINDINAPLAIKALKPIEARGTLEVITRAVGALNQIMTFATNTGLIFHNPLSGIKSAFVKKKTVNNPHLKPEQLPELMQMIAEANIKKVTRYILQWQLHTMTRPTETAKAEWSEIDLVSNTWTIPAEKMKKGVKHIIPLTDQTLEILERMKIFSHGKYIFPSDRNPTEPANSATANMALKRMGLQGKQTAHGLRGLARTALSDNAFSYEASEACLSHKVGNVVSQSYNHSTYFNPRVRIMKWWSEQVAQAKTGRSITASNVLHLKVG